MQQNSFSELNIKQLALELEQDPEIEFAILFGSCAKGNVTFNSDIDIAIKLTHFLWSETKLQLIQTIAEEMGRAVDLVDLNTVGEPLLNQIVMNGVVLKGSDEMFTALAIKNVYANEDFTPYIKRSLRARREKWIK